MRKYTATRWTDTVSFIEVESETPKFVWIRGRQTAKSSQSEWIRDTPEEAKQCLLDFYLRQVKDAEGKIRWAKRSLHNAKKLLGNIRKLKLPNEVKND